jgi:hypothetical protein
MKYVPGPLVGQLSRSQGNTTASRNRNGSYLRNRVNGVNPNTVAQTIQRNNLGELSGLYRTLTEAARSAWQMLGLQMVRTDTLGQVYSLTGLQAFTSVNRVRRLFGVADLLIAPAFTDPGTLTTFSNVYDVVLLGASTFIQTFTPTPLGAGKRLIVEATRPVSPGINFMPRSEYKAVLYTADNPGTGGDAAVAYEAIFGEPPVGTKIFSRARVVEETNFQGVPVEFQTIVVAT